jgi:hypothetical protein
VLLAMSILIIVQYESLHADSIPDDTIDAPDEQFTEAAYAIVSAESFTENTTLRFGEWHLDTSGYESVLPRDDVEDDDESIPTSPTTPVTPNSPLTLPGVNRLGQSGEAFVRKVVLRLQGLATSDKFRFMNRKFLNNSIFTELYPSDAFLRQLQSFF